VNSQVIGVDAAKYRPHDLHLNERIWLETNCYVDLWIELLHSMRLDPVACMAFTVAMDFEGDQWTFFKPPHSDLYHLYGLDVQELNIWRAVEDQIIDQVQRRRIPLVEVDSYFLPDTAGVAYGMEHTKTTIAVQAIDPERRRLGYFHNSGYFELGDPDYTGLFGAWTDGLAPYTEFVKMDRVVARDEGELTMIAGTLVRDYVGRMPNVNPVSAYRSRFSSDVKWLAERDMTAFYKYAFATLRQCGACAEMASTFLSWLAARTGTTSSASAELSSIATGAKTIQFKLARVMATGKPADLDPLLEQMESAWDRARTDLVASYGT
jgi:hypothetical protein